MFYDGNGYILAEVANRDIERKNKNSISTNPELASIALRYECYQLLALLDRILRL